MTGLDLRPIANIAVAVAFDENLPSILRLAEKFAIRTGVGIKLIHVCDRWNQSMLAATTGHRFDGMGNAIESENLFVAEQRLHRLIETMNPTINVEPIALVGDVVPTLLDAVSGREIDLLLIGSSVGMYSDGTHAFGKAIAVAQDSVVPVMVVNQMVRQDIFDHTMRVLIADNLGPEGAAALSASVNLALAMGGAYLLHSHVNTKEEMRSLANRLRSVTAGSFAPEEQAKDCFIQQRRDISNYLHDRAGILLKALDGTGSEYQTEVMSGSVVEQIHQAANAHLSDVVVFGQHVMVHRGQATSGGQMPYKAMFAQNRLVVVVPHHGRA